MIDEVIKYFENNRVDLLEKDDCYCYLKGDTSSIEDYFKNNFEEIDFQRNFDNFYVWRHSHLDKESSMKIINTNQTLVEINKLLEISHCFFMEISEMSFVNWHFDTPRKGPAINLLLTPESKSYSLFTHDIFDTSNLIECKYNPHQFCLYNTELIHSILNLDSPRYIFSVIFERGKTDLSWNEAKNILREYTIND